MISIPYSEYKSLRCGDVRPFKSVEYICMRVVCEATDFLMRSINVCWLKSFRFCCAGNHTHTRDVCFMNEILIADL